MKKKKSLVWLWILLGLLAILAGLAIWQRANIQATLQGVQESPEEIEQAIAQNEQRVQKAVESNPDITVRELTEDEKTELLDGTTSREELIDRLVETAEASSDAADEKTADKTTEKADEKSTYQTELSKLLAEVYVLQAEYNGALSGMMGQAQAEYSQMAASEKTKSNLISWAAGYVSKATDLESDCDAKIDAIAGKMLTLIKDNGGDTSVVDEVIDSYAEEKSLKKSWYLAQMREKGLL